MKRALLLALIAVVLFIIPASAEISLSQPKPIYNIDDILQISADIHASGEIDAILNVKLICGNSSKEISTESLYLAAGETYKIDKKRPFSLAFLGGMKGLCALSVSHGSDFSYTSMFEITNRINLLINSDKMNVNPNEKFVLKLSAVKADSQNAEGFAEISFDNSLSTIVLAGGKLETNLSFPANAKSGIHSISVLVYEKTKEGNKAEGKIDVRVLQVPTKIELELDSQTIVPGTGMKIIPRIYDQAEDEISSEVKISIIDSIGNHFSDSLIRTGEMLAPDFPENASPGNWKILSKALGLENERDFYVEELQKASFKLENDTLIVTNIGNVPYRKNIEVTIGDMTEILELNLELGEVRKFRLTAPEGSYSIKISDGTENLEGTAFLTGSTVGVNTISGSLGLLNKFPIVWLFLLLVSGMFIFSLSRRLMKKNTYGYIPDEESMKERPTGIKEERKAGLVRLSPDRKVDEAEHSLVLAGNKEEAGIIALKIKNYSALKGNAPESLNRAIESINDNKGSLYRNQESITGIFTPSVTKTFKNDVTAVKAATAIASLLNEHNKRYRDKIEFGIGVHYGEIAAKIDNGKLKFTPLGNSINIARKAADSAMNSALLTSQINKKVSNEVKTLKQGEFYSISRIVEREQHKEFLSGFKERNKFG